MTTKREIINAALDDLGINPATYDVSAEEYAAAKFKLDMMVVNLIGRGLRFGYVISADLDTPMPGMAQFAVEALYLRLALRLAPSYGKTPSPNTANHAQDAWANMVNALTVIPQMALGRDKIPSGAGNKGWRYNTPFLPRDLRDPTILPEDYLNSGDMTNDG